MDLHSFRRRINSESFIIAAIMAVFFVCVIMGMSIAVASVPPEPEEEVIEETAAYDNYLYSAPHSLLKDLSHSEEIYEPGADILNLAYFYPDDADTLDAIHSFAGETFSRLTSRTADLYASFYDLSDVTPLSEALSMGLAASRVSGGYNPTDPSHDPLDPSTWTINSFSNVSVSFYDGDGRRIDGYYPVREIMAMASVYMFHHDDFDPEHFDQYCDALFEEALSYRISLGNVYYCSGCLDKTVAEESSEALAREAEELALANNISLEAAYEILGTTESAALETIIDTRYETVAAKTQTSAPETIFETETPAETEPQTTLEYIYDPNLPIEETTQMSGVIYQDPSWIPTESSESDETESDAADSESEAPDQVAVAIGRYGGSDQIIEQTEPSDSPQAETAGYAVYSPDQSTVPKYYVDDEGVVSYDTIREGYEGPIDESEEAISEPLPDTAQEAPEDETADDHALYISQIQSLLQQADIEANSETYCPGHIDIYVTVTLRGVDDERGLYSADKIGTDLSGYDEDWPGWTDETMAEVESLLSQDWFELYGLSISSISLSSALSEEMIEEYLSSLPEDTSDLRREIVAYALESVGKVPYYWGGKPSGPGYDANNFGLLITPDTRGRILKGLDCSGWVNWIYWSVTGESLAGQSTGTLVGCGKKISRGELSPGDIIIRVGGDAHVVMFLCWAEDGDFYAVHETGGVINNVTVSKMTANWPYYRSLAD